MLAVTCNHCSTQYTIQSLNNKRSAYKARIMGNIKLQVCTFDRSQISSPKLLSDSGCISCGRNNACNWLTKLYHRWFTVLDSVTDIYCSTGSKPATPIMHVSNNACETVTCTSHSDQLLLLCRHHRRKVKRAYILNTKHWKSDDLNSLLHVCWREAETRRMYVVTGKSWEYTGCTLCCRGRVA